MHLIFIAFVVSNMITPPDTVGCSQTKSYLLYLRMFVVISRQVYEMSLHHCLHCELSTLHFQPQFQSLPIHLHIGGHQLVR